MNATPDVMVDVVGAVMKKLPKTFHASVPDGFVEHLFSACDPSGLHEIDAASLAQITRSSARLLAKRKPGRSLIKQTCIKQEKADATLFTLANDNQAFLLSSVVAEFIERGIGVQLILHPVFTVRRDKSGNLTDYGGVIAPTIGAWLRESHILILCERRIESEEAEAVLKSLQTIIHQVTLATRDWKPMIERVNHAMSAYETHPPAIPPEEVNEALAFLRWLCDNNFTFLGMREFRLEESHPEAQLLGENETALGILSDPDMRILRRGREYVVTTPEMIEFLKAPFALIVTKASIKSLIHRRVHLDYVGIKLFDDSGSLIGELRVVGLLTSKAYNKDVLSIPYLCRKAEMVMRETGFDPNGHSGKALMNVLDNYPRDELFQIDAETLTHHALATMSLKTRPRLRVLSRADKFDRYVSVLVNIPRDLYNIRKQNEIGDYLADRYEGRVSAIYPDYPEANFARIHFIIGRYEGKTPRVSSISLERDIASIVRNWVDDFRVALVTSHGIERAQEIYAKYSEAYSAAYQHRYDPTSAVRDYDLIEALRARGSHTDVILTVPKSAKRGQCVIKIYHQSHPSPLSERVPMLENLSFRVVNERTYEIAPRGMPSVYLHEMALEASERLTCFDSEGEFTNRALVEDTYRALVNGDIENDGFNALSLNPGIRWEKVIILRAIARYLRLAGLSYSLDYFWETLRAWPALASDMVALFESRFTPDGASEDQAAIRLRISEQLEVIASLDQDRIIRGYLRVIDACVRTSFYQEDRVGLALKIRSGELDFLPDPKPLFEIYIYDQRFEGVHLRFGKVARGGIRWSDRPQDFRTEVLGLVKAQQSKNAVIAPVGAKGGFVPRQIPQGAERTAISEEGKACYRLYIRSALALADNYDSQGSVLHPPKTRRYDDDDPYFVVAADKGTATFSDEANAISQSLDFWLDDAFASGGSAGYDHKAMGITARGAFEAVKRHFREMNHDCMTEPFTVIGVGDMSGDVFGNGMLLSPVTKLLAAFDHRDIFIDPDPDPEVSFAERKRLFAKPRSSWQDYDRKSISSGGGVYSRSEKAIALSKSVRQWLDLGEEKIAPSALIQAILRAKADLLWFGGVGTYVRASDEANSDVGDHTNDALRVCASELGVKVIGEGANLGITQRGRVEFALAGGRINTDAIDNSGGVNSSDVEVNIKIALSAAMRSGRIDRDSRNKLLSKMTDQVAALVLENNYRQTACITMARTRAAEGYHYQKHLMGDLETSAGLDRRVEFLPNDSKLSERTKRNDFLTRPEISVLQAYTKNELFSRTLRSDLPDDPYFLHALRAYFPPAMQKDFSEEIASHPLRREIIATLIANRIIDHGGTAFENRLRYATRAPSKRLVRAFVIAFDAFELGERFKEIDALDNRIDAKVQNQIYVFASEMLYWACSKLTLYALPEIDLGERVKQYNRQIKEVRQVADQTSSPAFKAHVNLVARRFTEIGLDEDFARKLANDEVTTYAPGIIHIAARAKGKFDVKSAAQIFFALDACFGFADIFTLATAGGKAERDYYDILATERAIDRLYGVQVDLARRILEKSTHSDPLEAFQAWRDQTGPYITHVTNGLRELFDGKTPNLSRLVLAAELFRQRTPTGQASS